MSKNSWLSWEGKKALIILRSNKTYECNVLEVEATEYGIVWFHVEDKFGKRLSFVNSEIEVIKEVLP